MWSGLVKFIFLKIKKASVLKDESTLSRYHLYSPEMHLALSLPRPSSRLRCIGLTRAGLIMQIAISSASFQATFGNLLSLWAFSQGPIISARAHNSVLLLNLEGYLVIRRIIQKRIINVNRFVSIKLVLSVGLINDIVK